MGNALSFVPVVTAPTVTTTTPSIVQATSATLTAVVSDGRQSQQQGGGSSTYHFDYGTDPAFGSFTSTTSGNFSGLGVSVSAGVTGLTSGTRYYCRVVATNGIGTTAGNVISFETSTNLPTLVSPSNGTVSLIGDTTFTWIYNSGGASGGQTGFSLQLTGNVPGHSGSGPWYWTGSGWSATQTWIASTAQSLTLAAGWFLASTPYSWTVATEDANGQGPYA